MIDTAVHYPRSAAPPRPLDYLPEMAGFLIIVLMSIVVPSISKYLTLAWLGLTAMLIVARPVQFAATLLRWWPLLLVPLIATLSFYWSENPGISARYGLQLLITAIVGVFLARLIPSPRFAVMLFLATFAFCVMSLVYGRQGPSEEGLVLVGFTTSKNQMALWGFLLIFSAFGAMFHASTPRFVRLLTLPGVAIGAFVVATTESATAVVLSIVGVGLFCILNIMSRVGPSGRTGTMAACLLLAIPVIALTPEILDFGNYVMINVLERDPDLTGRAYLWERADQLIAQRPILGYGYQSFWQGGSLESREILAWAGQGNSRGFHFHSTYRQIAVDLGFVGMGILVVTMIGAAFAAMRHFIVHGRTETAFFLTMYILLIALSVTELVVTTFSITTVLFFACLHYQFSGPPLAVDESALDPYANMRMPGPPRVTPR